MSIEELRWAMDQVQPKELQLLFSTQQLLTPGVRQALEAAQASIELNNSWRNISNLGFDGFEDKFTAATKLLKSYQIIGGQHVFDDYFRDLASKNSIGEIEKLTRSALGTQGVISEKVLKSIAQMNALPFESHIVNLARSSAELVSSLGIDNFKGGLDTTDEVELEAIEEVVQSDDYSTLTDRAQKIVVWVIIVLLLPIMLNMISDYAYDNLKRFKETLSEAQTPADARKMARNPGPEVDLQVLSDYRIITGYGVNLRAGPSMSAQILYRLDLPDLVEVLDKSNRSWLQVSFDLGDEVIEGWVSRTYTKPIG